MLSQEQRTESFISYIILNKLRTFFLLNVKFVAEVEEADTK